MRMCVSACVALGVNRELGVPRTLPYHITEYEIGRFSLNFLAGHLGLPEQFNIQPTRASTLPSSALIFSLLPPTTITKIICIRCFCPSSFSDRISIQSRHYKWRCCFDHRSGSVSFVFQVLVLLLLRDNGSYYIFLLYLAFRLLLFRHVPL